MMILGKKMAYTSHQRISVLCRTKLKAQTFFKVKAEGAVGLSTLLEFVEGRKDVTILSPYTKPAAVMCCTCVHQVQSFLTEQRGTLHSKWVLFCIV